MGFLEEPEIQNGMITEVAGPQVERLADAAAALFASRGDSLEIREVRQPEDPDAAAYAAGAALPNPGAKLAGPTFEDWLAAAKATEEGQRERLAASSGHKMDTSADAIPITHGHPPPTRTAPFAAG